MAIVLKHPSQVKAEAKKEDLPIHDSSFLMSASYDADQMVMTVTMRSGSQYMYNYIYPSTFESFKQAKNKSKFYSDNIRGKEKGSRSINKSIGPAISKKTKT